MYTSEYDAERVILFSMHFGGALSDADVDHIVASLKRAVTDAIRQRMPVTNLVIVDSGHGPTALQRKRIGEAVSAVKSGYAAFVVRSPLLRAVITAIGWFRQGNRDNIQSTHATYQEARKWLVARSGYDAEVFDAMERQMSSRIHLLERAS